MSIAELSGKQISLIGYKKAQAVLAKAQKSVLAKTPVGQKFIQKQYKKLSGLTITSGTPGIKGGGALPAYGIEQVTLFLGVPSLTRAAITGAARIIAPSITTAATRSGGIGASYFFTRGVTTVTKNIAITKGGKLLPLLIGGAGGFIAGRLFGGGTQQTAQQTAAPQVAGQRIMTFSPQTTTTTTTTYAPISTAYDMFYQLIASGQGATVYGGTQAATSAPTVSTIPTVTPSQETVVSPGISQGQAQEATQLGGMDTTTLLILAALGIGAIVLLKD